MAELAPAGSHELWLQVQAPTGDLSVFTVILDDGAGHTGSGVFTFHPERPLDPGGSWDKFLRTYLEEDPSADELRAFGRDLFRAVIEELPEVRSAWSAARGASGDRPPVLNVELGRLTERFASLPLELMADASGSLFAQPQSALRRTYQETSPKAFRRPETPRVLFAWACPLLSGDPFSPEPHAEALARVFDDANVERLDNASLQSLRETLVEAESKGAPFHYVHLLAHGYRDVATAGIHLATSTGVLDPVDAESLARAVAGRGLELVFLCSCQTAVAGREAFSGVGQQLVLPWGGDLAAVVATQANLPVRGSAELSERFYRLLAERGDPALALAEARRVAYDRGGRAWSAPVLIARPATERRGTRRVAEIAGLPLRRSTYLDRPDVEQEVLAALSHGRLVSVVGLPGIGKTEICREAARRARAEGLSQRVIYREAHQGMDAAAMRPLLALAAGQQEVADDEELAAAFEALDASILLLIDNAEDLMRTESTQEALRTQIDTLLAYSPRLKILLSTRWPVGATRESEREVEVPPLDADQTHELLMRELRGLGTLQEHWLETPAWADLVRLIDGHPRSLWLISRHFGSRRATLEGVRDRLLALREHAVVAPDLLGRREVDAQQRDRLRSLVASMDLSFEIVEERHPEAVEAFIALSLFPAGLPESVAREVTGGTTSLALDHLFYYHLIQWRDERTFYPVPLHWYAERKRQDRPIDEALYRQRALSGFAEFAESCNQLITTGSIVAGVDRLLKEKETLTELTLEGPAPSTETTPRSDAARIAIASSNGLQLTAELDLAVQLARSGLAEATKLGDQLGEANCLQSLGDLQRRVSDLDAAKGAYQKALHIYRDIRKRIGEANCLQSLGDLQRRVSDLDAAKDAYQKALPIYRDIRDRLGEANCLLRLGDLHIRVDDLKAAKDAYEKALHIYRDIRERIGEANCLKSLGDLQRRVDDLKAAKDAYENALHIYRDIRDRLGEANCLKSVGLLELTRGDVAVAFRTFLHLLETYRELREGLGEQASLGYLARTAASADRNDRAIVLAEMSLAIGRRINDRFGQTITLDLQISVWLQTEDFMAALSAMMINRDLAISIRDEPQAERYHQTIEQLLEALPEDDRQPLEQDPESVRRAAVEQAQERLTAAGEDPLSPLE